jgi:hypothetical protein
LGCTACATSPRERTYIHLRRKWADRPMPKGGMRCAQRGPSKVPIGRSAPYLRVPGGLASREFRAINRGYSRMSPIGRGRQIRRKMEGGQDEWGSSGVSLVQSLDRLETQALSSTLKTKYSLRVPADYWMGNCFRTKI